MRIAHTATIALAGTALALTGACTAEGGSEPAPATAKAAAEAPATPAVDPDEANGVALILGDSITEQYNEIPGDLKYAWWSMLADDIHMRPVVSAESGAGFLMGGDNCSPLSRRLGERLGAVGTIDPEIVIVEAGRNDLRYCAGPGKPAVAPRSMTEEAIQKYMHDLALAVTDAGIARFDVYALTPWGTDRPQEASYIRPMVKKYAQKYGFRWVHTDILSDDLTLDRTHPNLEGSKALREQIVEGSDLLDRFGDILDKNTPS